MWQHEGSQEHKASHEDGTKTEILTPIFRFCLFFFFPNEWDLSEKGWMLLVFV